MCLIELVSTNPCFSFIISKNPSSGMIIRPIRQGVAYGYYANQRYDNKRDGSDRYIIYFRDRIDSCSYKETAEQEFDYLNKLRYTSPIFVLNAIGEFLNNCLKKQQPQDIENISGEIHYQQTFRMAAVQIDNHAFKMITNIHKFFDDVIITLKEIATETYNVEITTKKTLYYLLNFVFLYFGLISFVNNNDLYNTENLIEKVIASANAIEVKYYLRYLISSKLLTNKSLFEKLKHSLETSGIQLNYGNTALQRLNYIKNSLTFKNSIIDIGCGEDYYAIPFARNLKKHGLKYYAIDTDDKELEKVRKKSIKYDLDIITLNSHEKLLNYITDECYDVIITEVVEHMEKETSQELIRWVLNHVNYHQVIITTPNIEFNVNYVMSNSFRHPDHKWELTRDQFKKYTSEIVNGMSNEITEEDCQFIDIGDAVDGIHLTQGCIIKK